MSLVLNNWAQIVKVNRSTYRGSNSASFSSASLFIGGQLLQETIGPLDFLGCFGEGKTLSYS